MRRALAAYVGCAALVATAWAGSAQAVLRAAEPSAVAGGVEPPPATVIPAAAGIVGALAPHRIFDSRRTKPFAPGEERSVCDTVGRVPIDAAGVVVNLTVVAPAAAGYLTAWPLGDDAPPPVSNLNFAAGATTSNLSVLELGAVGCVTVRNSSKGSTHLLVDVQGYLTDGPASAPSTTQTIYPSRLLDTRTNGVTIPAKGSLEVQVAGRGGIPATAVAATWLNVTVTGNAAHGYVTAYPTGDSRPTAATLNFGAGETRAGFTLAKLGRNGRVTMYNGSAKPVHLVVDAAGWVRAGGSTGALAGVTPVAPTRVTDTRTTEPVGAGQKLSVDPPNAPAGAGAAILAVTAVDADKPGYLVVAADDGRSTDTSAVNFVPGRATTNLVLVRRDALTTVVNGSSQPVDVVVDVVGWVNAERAVAGRVVDTAGNGLASSNVYAVPLTVYLGRNAADGSFDLPLPPTVTSVTPCAQVVNAGLPATGWAPGCHRSWTNRTSYPLALGQRLAGADIPVERAGVLRGTATDWTGAALTSGTISLLRAGDDRRYSGKVTNGQWGIANVAAGDYYVALDGAGSATATSFGLASEWYPDVQPGLGTAAAMAEAGAEAVTVTGSATTLLDLVAEPRAKVSGTLAAAPGSPALGTTARVVLRRANGTTFSTLATVPSGSSTWSSSAVHPGSLTACARRGPGTAEVCWEGNVPLEQASPVLTTAGEERTGITITLP